MSDDFGIRINPKQFFVSTMHLTAKEVGAWMLLASFLSHKGCLPDDDVRLARVARLSVRQWRKVRSDVLEALHADFWDPCSRIVGRRRAIPAEVRSLVIDRDGERCAYCGAETGPFHLDHIVPWSKGGSDDPENLTVACVPCNLSKRDKTLDEWRAQQ